MASAKASRQTSRAEPPSKADFIIPPTTSKALKIEAPKTEAPPRKTGKVVSSAAATNGSAPSSRSRHKSPAPEASSFSPPRPVGVADCPDTSSSRSIQSASKQAPPAGTRAETVVPSSRSRPPSAQSDGGLDAAHLAPAPRPVAESTLDIYAPNYVPKWQTAINESPATPRPCCPLSTIHYATYIERFAGSRILSTVPPATPALIRTVPSHISSAPEDLSPQHYGEYFSDALQSELAAQVAELRTFSMYHVTIDMTDESQHLYHFTIPGLREDSPQVNLGDVVKIRPLTGASQLPYLPGRPGYQDLPLQFSGFEFGAIVWGISRREERIVLRMDGFMPNLYRTCNVIFTVQEHRCTPLWRSIRLAARLLNSRQDPSTSWLRQMLFPDPQHATLQSSLSTGNFGPVWFDSEMNFEQQKAVDAVVTANYGSVPYLISGPPGTGKTKTIVETALQLLRSTTAELVPHLLLCAPSDPAADTLVTRLSAHLDPRSLFRLNGWTRSFAEVPDNVLPYTNIQHDLFSLPDFERMMSYGVVVTTCKDADMLVQARLTNEALTHLVLNPLAAIAPKLSTSIDPTHLIHWTALLFDEAAQATEPEALIPLSVVAPATSTAAPGAGSTEWSHPVPQLVMAGDEYQLGPRLSRKSASPLSSSLFARLFARPLYSAHPLSRANGSRRLTSAMLPMLRPTFTNLIRNYRSHPAILSVPSALFYADTLIPERTMLSDVVRTWPGWHEADVGGGSRRVALANMDAGDVESGDAEPPNLRCWPVLFVNHSGSDALESIIAGRGAGGLFNPSEAAIALRIVKSLLGHSTPRPPTDSAPSGRPPSHVHGDASPAGTRNDSIQPGEIVVMSPFGAQVNYLRQTFRGVGLHQVNIGPVEAFQGLEGRIVILCTTRTRLGAAGPGIDRFVRDDQARGLGVIGEQKKFNVAISRAKEGLIVVGNRDCLTCTGDEAWLEFLAFCDRTRPDRSDRTSTRPSQRPGRLEQALRFEEKVDRRRREAGHGDGRANERSPRDGGPPTRQEPSGTRLRGTMPSLEEDMFREGLRMADAMRSHAEDNGMYGADEEAVGGCGSHDAPENVSVQNARQFPGRPDAPELSQGAVPAAMMAASNGESWMPHIQRAAEGAGARRDALIDRSNAPRSTGPGTTTPGNRQGQSGTSFGSFTLPVRTRTGEHGARGGEDWGLGGHEEVNGFDRDLAAEVERHERADCAAQ